MRTMSGSSGPLWLVFVIIVLSACFYAELVMADESLPEERVVQLLLELSERLEGADKDCDKIADTLKDWADANRDELPALARETRDHASELDPAQLEELNRRLEPAMEIIFTAAMQCSEHEATSNAFLALDELVHGQVSAKQ